MADRRVIGVIGLFGWPWVALAAATAVYALARGTYGFVVALAAVCVVRGLHVWATIGARARHQDRTIGDPAVYHDDWLYRRGEAVRGRDWLRCNRCHTRLRPGEPTVEGIAPVPAAAAGLPAVLQERDGVSHAGFLYCESCGTGLRQRQGDEAARARALLEAPRAAPPEPSPNPGLRRASAVALALSFAALVLLPSPGAAVLIVLIAILLASLFGLGVARHGWALYGENPWLLVAMGLALLALAVPLGVQLSQGGDPHEEPIPGAVTLKPVFVAGTPDNRSADAVMRELERSQDVVALSLLASYERGMTDTAWWSSTGARSAGKLARLVHGYRRNAGRVRDPALRRRYLEIHAAGRRRAGELARLQQALAGGRAGDAGPAALRARIAGDEATRLRASLVIR